MKVSGYLPFEILHLPEASRYTQADASDEGVLEKIRLAVLAKDSFSVDWDAKGMAIITISRKMCGS